MELWVAAGMLRKLNLLISKILSEMYHKMLKEWQLCLLLIYLRINQINKIISEALRFSDLCVL